MQERCCGHHGRPQEAEHSQPFELLELTSKKRLTCFFLRRRSLQLAKISSSLKSSSSSSSKKRQSSRRVVVPPATTTSASRSSSVQDFVLSGLTKCGGVLDVLEDNPCSGSLTTPPDTDFIGIPLRASLSQKNKKPSLFHATMTTAAMINETNQEEEQDAATKAKQLFGNLGMSATNAIGNTGRAIGNLLPTASLQALTQQKYAMPDKTVASQVRSGRVGRLSEGSPRYKY